MNDLHTNGTGHTNGGDHDNDSNQPIEIAIIGGGIIGVILALGLIKRNINVTIYEQSRGFREIGAGVAFTSNAIKAMNILDPRIVEALKKIATPNGDPENPTDYLKFLDGYHRESDDPNDTSEKLLFQLYTGYRGFAGCHRAHLMDEIVKLMPEGRVIFGKRLDSYVDGGDGADSKVVMKFTDGTTAEADAGKYLAAAHPTRLAPEAVVGCDGIKSRVRQLLLGEDHPAAYPHYSHKYAYRGLVPMDRAVAALGHYKAHNQHMHVGPNAHVLTFPVAGHTLMNVVAFVTDPQEWSSKEKMTRPARREEVVKAFGEWGPAVRAITNLLPEELDKWGIFDTYDHPAPKYAEGRVCLAGDAAHASSPHHGGGAGVGVEDALALVSLMERVTKTLQTPASSSVGNLTQEVIPKARALSAAFAAYDPVRRERTQWFVSSSRGVCETYEWNDPNCGSDPEKCYAEIRWRSHRLWHFDLEYMMGEAGEGYRRLLTEGTNQNGVLKL